MPQCGWIFYDVSEKQSYERGEAIEARALRQPQNHPCALQLSKHHSIVVIACEAQTQTQCGMEGVWVHRNADHTDAGTDKNGGHVLSQALDDNISALSVVRLQGR